MRKPGKILSKGIDPRNQRHYLLIWIGTVNIACTCFKEDLPRLRHYQVEIKRHWHYPKPLHYRAEKCHFKYVSKEEWNKIQLAPINEVQAPSSSTYDFRV